MTALTPKQEAFCLRYIETGNASEAYRLSYDADSMKPATVNRTAFDLLENPKIAARLEELRGMSVRRHLVTIDTLTAELDELKAMARDNGQYSPAVTAVMGKAKLHGLLVDKGEITGKDGAPLEAVKIYLPDNSR